MPEGMVRHSSSASITEQRAGARVSVNVLGRLQLQVDRGWRIDAVKAMLWAFYAMATDPPLVPGIW